MVSFSQAARFLKLETPLGPDALLLEGLKGQETLSRPYEFELRLLASGPIDFAALLGQRAALALEVPGCPLRRFHGLIRELRQVEDVAGPAGPATFLRYTARLVPRLWLLTQSRRQRIWQGRTVPEIVTQILRDEWRLDVRVHLGGSYRTRNYCVQYAESDFDFVNRLLEDEGIRYHFEQTPGDEVLVLADRWAQVTAIAEPNHLSYRTVQPEGAATKPRVTAWGKSQRLVVNRYQLQDECFEMPSKPLLAQAQPDETAVVGRAMHAFRSVHERMQADEFPCGLAARYDGIDPRGAAAPQELPHLFEDIAALAARRARAEAAASLTVEGASTAAHLEVGRRFALDGYRDADGDYLLTAVEHEAGLQGAYLTSGETPVLRYGNHFHCLPAALTYYPARLTAKPFVRGPQTATVVGPAGEEVFCDKYGRVRVRFAWEQADESSSCWLRVAQAWAGKGFGALHVPRIGHEVVVDFQDGDPDRPILIASLYNAEQMPPYNLPDEVGQSGIRSQHLGGNGRYSEVCFSDVNGQQGLQLKSHNDLHTIAGNNQHTEVGSNYGIWAGSGLNITIGGGSGGGGGGWDEFKESWTHGWSLNAPSGWEFYEGDYKQTCVGLGLFANAVRVDMSGIATDITTGGHWDIVLGGYKQTHIGTSTEYRSSESKIVGTKSTTFTGLSHSVTAGGELALVGSTVIVDSAVSMDLSCMVSKIALTPASISLGATSIFLSAGGVELSLSPGKFMVVVGEASLTVLDNGIMLEVGASSWILTLSNGLVCNAL